MARKIYYYLRHLSELRQAADYFEKNIRKILIPPSTVHFFHDVSQIPTDIEFLIIIHEKEFSPDQIVAFKIINSIRELFPYIQIIVLFAGKNQEDENDYILAGANQVISLTDKKKLQKLKKHLIDKKDLLTTDYLEWERGYFRFPGGILIGQSASMLQIIKTVKRISNFQTNILITGETGTGKELVALALHQLSKKNLDSFAAINCGSIPDTLIESELFGVVANYPGFHNKSRQIGKLEYCEDGTLFLDEIGNSSMELQSKILRILEVKSFSPIGSHLKFPLKCQIVSATNADILSEIEKGTFRKDLYYRLNVLSVHIPPLRERPSDIPDLVRYFLLKYYIEYGIHKVISDHGMGKLCAYPWPGNVRELKNEIHRLIVFGETEVIPPESILKFKPQFDPLKKSVPSLEFPQPKKTIPIQPLKILIKETEISAIQEAMNLCEGNKSKMALYLGLTRKSLYQKIKKYKLLDKPGGV